MSRGADTALAALRRRQGQEFPFFRRCYFSHEHPDAEFHQTLCNCLSELKVRRGIKAAVAAPRDSGKSTIVSLEYVVHCLCYKLEPYIVLMSNTSDQASDNLSHIKAELMSNERLIRDFPDVCEIGTKPGPPRWRQHEIITRNGSKITALGSDQQIRGRRHRHERPSLIILDDIEPDEGTFSGQASDDLFNRLMRSVINAGSLTTNVIAIGTIHHYHSVVARLVNPQDCPGWTKWIYRSVMSWSAHPELWETWAQIYHGQEEYKERRGPEAALEFFQDNRATMLEGTRVLWETSRNYYALMEKREEIGRASFDAEYQNDPTDPRNSLFNVEEVYFWDAIPS